MPECNFVVLSRMKTRPVTRRDSSQRLNTDSQSLIPSHLRTSAFSSDKITIFSIRPRELIFANRKTLFWFARKYPQKKGSVYLKCVIHVIELSSWVNELVSIVKLRASAVNHFKGFVEQQLLKKATNLRFFDTEIILSKNTNMDVKSRFVPPDPRFSNTVGEVVESNSLPYYPVKFDIPLLYSSGEFGADLELFDVPTLKANYVRANSIPATASIIADDRDLAQRYVLEKLVETPGRT